jgi:hypothetical protein
MPRDHGAMTDARAFPRARRFHHLAFRDRETSAFGVGRPSALPFLNPRVELEPRLHIPEDDTTVSFASVFVITREHHLASRLHPRGVLLTLGQV